MGEERKSGDLVPAAKADAGLIEEEAGHVRLTPVSFTTTIEGAPLTEQRAFSSVNDTLARPPVAGMLSVIFAFVAFYHVTLLMAPLAIIAGVVAFFMKQRNWAAIGIIAGFVALISDVYFWGLLGISWGISWLWPLLH